MGLIFWIIVYVSIFVICIIKTENFILSFSALLLFLFSKALVWAILAEHLVQLFWTDISVAPEWYAWLSNIVSFSVGLITTCYSISRVNKDSK